MKKIYLIIILFLGLYPVLQSGKLLVIQSNKLFAQSAANMLQGFLIQQNNAINIANNSNNGHSFQPGNHGCGCQVVEYFGDGTFVNHYSYEYQSTPAFQAYLSSTNTNLPPTSNENQGGNSQVNWNQIQMQLDMIRSQERTDAFSEVLNWILNSTGGNEQTNNLPPCDESMFSISSSRDFFAGTLPPLSYPNAVSLGGTNIACTNKFLVAGNIISFNNPHLTNIENYAFAGNELKSVKFYNGDIYRRAINCEVIVETTTTFSTSSSCGSSNETTYTLLANKIGSYKYVCFPKLTTIGGVFEDFSSSGETYYGGTVPANLSGRVFTLPDSCIKPAQPGNIVLGINSSNTYSCQTLDCAKVANGTASYDNCGACTGGSTGAPPCTQTQSSTTYYTTLNNDTTKYYNDDTIYMPQRSAQVKLTIHKVGGTLAPTDLIWKRKDTTKCTNVVECFVSSNLLGVTVMRVDSGTTILIKNPLAIYKVPTLYFKRGNNYGGEYGFDDSTHKYLNIRNNDTFKLGYKVRNIMSDSNYFVPWLSLLDKDTSIIRDSLINFSAWAKKDKSGYVEFKTNTNKIVFSSSKIKYINLNNINDLSIYVEQWNVNIENLRKARIYDSLFKTIYAITNTGDTIGCMSLSASKPVQKLIKFIYVNIGNGYDSTVLKRTTILNLINKKSHNQIFRKWDLVNEHIDTLNVSAEFYAHPEYFTYDNEGSLLGKLRGWYFNRTGVQINEINLFPGNNASLSTWKRFAFIMPIIMSKDSLVPTGDTKLTDFILGGFKVGGTSGLFYKNATPATFGHEAGHALNLNHTWEVSFLVPKFSTANIMDYTIRNGVERLNQFWYAQWMKTY